MRVSNTPKQPTPNRFQVLVLIRLLFMWHSAAPEVLCLNYKRFINLGFFNSKINALVDFPLESLDIGDYMTQASGYFRPAWKQYPIYDLTVLIYHRG